MTIGSTPLRRCPFCCGAAKLGKSKSGCHYICCDRCDAASRLCLPLEKDTVDPALIDAWNRREEGTALNIAIAALCNISDICSPASLALPAHLGDAYRMAETALMAIGQRVRPDLFRVHVQDDVS